MRADRLAIGRHVRRIGLMRTRCRQQGFDFDQGRVAGVVPGVHGLSVKRTFLRRGTSGCVHLQQCMNMNARDAGDGYSFYRFGIIGASVSAAKALADQRKMR